MSAPHPHRFWGTNRNWRLHYWSERGWGERAWGGWGEMGSGKLKEPLGQRAGARGDAPASPHTRHIATPRPLRGPSTPVTSTPCQFRAPFPTKTPRPTHRRCSKGFPTRLQAAGSPVPPGSGAVTIRCHSNHSALHSLASRSMIGEGKRP